uniref:Uncharacterized protein n=1 Tax=Vitis vinifera TaxID=29760 RepID=A5CAK0_VITVI|nr:hypothetical protein VITISV_033559 [Vitis vinifera]
MDEECCWSTEYGRGRGYKAPKVTDIDEAKCGNESITTPRAPLDDDGYSDNISSIFSILRQIRHHLIKSKKHNNQYGGLPSGEMHRTREHENSETKYLGTT